MGSSGRRAFLEKAGLGLGGLALGVLLDEEAQAAAPVLKGKAKRVIHIFASGAPSHVDTFDPKPALERFRDKTLPGQSGVAFPSPFKFVPRGQSGLPMSEVFPRLGEVADELCVIRSMHTEVPAHGPAALLMHTGNAILKRPSLGSWVLYGLGMDNKNLPGFIALGGSVEWRQASFLPSPLQGSQAAVAPGLRPDEVLPNLRNEFSGADQQRMQLDLARNLNTQHMKKVQRDEQLEARIESFELAFRMQTAATDAFDLAKESKEVRDRYGKGPLGARLLTARRLVERGVRFVQVDAGGWDHHQRLEPNLRRVAESTDTAASALIKDLRERGLLDSTLVVWGGEFGRTVTTAGKVDDDSGRDHHAKCFSVWMAGGGVKGGMAHGATDELGLDITEKPVHIHDLHATILRLLGFDHTRLTFRYNGREFRLTDNSGKVVDAIIA